MRKVENKFIPLPEANTEKVRFNLDFPRFVDASRIGVDVEGIAAMCRMGGIKHLRVIGETEGKTTSQEVNIVGFTSRGEAFAGKGKTSNVPTMHSDSQLTARYRGLFSHCDEWINVTTTLNMDEITSRIMRERKFPEGVRSIDAWTAHLNRDIKTAIRQKGTRHLLFGLSKAQLFFLAFYDLPWKIPTGPQDFIAPFLGGNIGGLIIGQGISRISGGRPRFSCFFGPELDRAAVLQVMTRTQTLVKPIG